MKQSKTLYALLGWLQHESLSGYDLKKRCEEYLSDFWYGSFGQIYPLLHQMEHEGLVTMREEPSDEGRPPRKVYSITTAGIERFEQWMREDPEPDLFRSELMLRLFFGRNAPREMLVRQVEAVRRDAARTLAALDQFLNHTPQWAQNNPNAPYQRILLDRGFTVNQGFIEWCDRTLNTLRSLDGEKALPSQQEGNHE
ncbi:MAG: PadR family transcriptional regulator [bacterium]